MMRCATGFQGCAGSARGKRFWLCSAAITLMAVQGAGGTALATEPHATAHTAVAGTLDHRVAVLTKALALDERQQAELQRIFTNQREAVRKIWRDPALMAAERGPATRAVEDRTADQIRSILSDEQKKLYNPPKPQTPASAPPDVAAWMETARTGHH
jgi:hypothetical protein